MALRYPLYCGVLCGTEFDDAPLAAVPVHGFRLSVLSDDDFADLNYRSLVGVVGNVREDFLRVWAKARLECLDGIAKNVAHADVGCRRARSTARDALVDRVVLA